MCIVLAGDRHNERGQVVKWAQFDDGAMANLNLTYGHFWIEEYIDDEPAITQAGIVFIDEETKEIVNYDGCLLMHEKVETALEDMGYKLTDKLKQQIACKRKRWNSNKALSTEDMPCLMSMEKSTSSRSKRASGRGKSSCCAKERTTKSVQRKRK